MRFVPMNFGCTYRAIFQAYSSNAFLLSPIPLAVLLTQSRNVSNRASRRDYFYISDLSDYFKIHRVYIKSFSAGTLK
jgi:hypothetical protein